jgi:hypothetical protein
MRCFQQPWLKETKDYTLGLTNCEYCDYCIVAIVERDKQTNFSGVIVKVLELWEIIMIIRYWSQIKDSTYTNNIHNIIPTDISSLSSLPLKILRETLSSEHSEVELVILSGAGTNKELISLISE